MPPMLSAALQALEPTAVSEEFPAIMAAQQPYKRLSVLSQFATRNHANCCWPPAHRVWQTCTAAHFRLPILKFHLFYVGPAGTPPAARRGLLSTEAVSIVAGRLERDFWDAYKVAHTGKDAPFISLMLRFQMTTQHPAESIAEYTERFNNHHAAFDARRPKDEVPLPSWYVDRLYINGLDPTIAHAISPALTDDTVLPADKQARLQLLSQAETRAREMHKTNGLPARAVLGQKAHYDAATMPDIEHFMNARHRGATPALPPAAKQETPADPQGARGRGRGRGGYTAPPPAGSPATAPPAAPAPAPTGTPQANRRLCWSCDRPERHDVWDCPEFSVPANHQRLLNNFRSWWTHKYKSPAADTVQPPTSAEDFAKKCKLAVRRPEN